MAAITITGKVVAANINPSSPRGQLTLAINEEDGASILTIQRLATDLGALTLTPESTFTLTLSQP